MVSGARYLVAGAILSAIVWLRGVPLPSRTSWQGHALLGFLMLGLGNGALVWAEQWVPSGMAAVMVATIPFWMTGVEALCRWNHPLRGNVPPTDFIPIAEGSELIIPLGEWVLRKACLEAKPWTGLTVAVNVSPLQFRRQDFVEVIERILTETGIDPHRVELELTESTLLGNVEEAEKAMHRLKKLDKVAYVRFASVYMDFKDVQEFMSELKNLLKDRVKK